MVRILLLLGACLLVATHAKKSASQCVLNGADAVSDLMDAGVFSWAASQRCGKGKENIVKCEIDVASAVESVNRMVNVIVRAVDQCQDITTQKQECGLAAGELTASFAGLAAASGGVVQECPNSIQKSQGLSMADKVQGAADNLQDANSATMQQWAESDQTTCLIDVKDSMRQIFEAGQYITDAKESCDDKGVCTYNVMGVISSLAGLGKFLMGAIGHCHAPGKPGIALPASFPLNCAENIDDLIRELTSFAGAAAEMSSKCGQPEGPRVVTVDMTVEVPVTPAGLPERLFVEEDGDASSTPVNVLNTVLAAFLPVTAVVSFVGGVKLRAHQHANPTHRETYTSLAPLVPHTLTS